MVRATIIVFGILSSQAVAAPKTEWGNFQCKSEASVYCGADGTCAPSQNKSAEIIVIPEASTYMRCTVASDLQTCDSYQVTTKFSGRYLVASSGGGSFFAKIDEQLLYTEVVSVGHDILIARGKCADGPPIVTTRTPAPR